MPDPTPWIVVNGNLGNAFCCMRCGESYEPRYPARFEIVDAIGKAFSNVHARCAAHPEGDACPYCMGRHAAEACPQSPERKPGEDAYAYLARQRNLRDVVGPNPMRGG